MLSTSTVSLFHILLPGLFVQDSDETDARTFACEINAHCKTLRNVRTQKLARTLVLSGAYFWVTKGFLFSHAARTNNDSTELSEAECTITKHFTAAAFAIH